MQGKIAWWSVAATHNPPRLHHSHALPPLTVSHMVPATVQGTRMVLVAAHSQQSPTTPTLYCLEEPGPGTPRQLARSTVRELAQPLAHVSYCTATQQLVVVSSSAVLTVFARHQGGAWSPLATVQLRQTTEAGSVAVVWLGAVLIGCLHSSSSVLSVYDLLAEEQHHVSAGVWWGGCGTCK